MFGTGFRAGEAARRCLGQAWRWRVQVRPVPDLLCGAVLCGAVLYAAVMWVPRDAVDTVREVLLLVIVLLVVFAVAVFVSAWRQVRGRR